MRPPRLSYPLGAFLALALCAPAGAAERRTVARELQRMQDSGAIAFDERRTLLREYRDTRRLAARLPGRRKLELEAVVGHLDRIAATRRLTVSRLEPLWLTLERNREWWRAQPLLASGTRVSFEGSELVWQYYPGNGLQLQPLANFGKLNALWRSRANARLELLLDELLDLAVERSGGLAWEYSFPIYGREFPWVSGLAQGTAAQALSRAGIRLRRKEEVLTVARAALGVFTQPPPDGVRIERPRGGPGAHYLLYSSRPDLRVLNGFSQALVGIHDYARYANDDFGRQLFDDGERALRREAPAFDTGAWSLYAAGGGEASLNYHELNREFLASLCDRTQREPYCSLEQRFAAYKTTPPVVSLVSRRLRGGTRSPVKFRLSKISSVVLTIARGGRTVFTASGTIGGGARSFEWAVPRKPAGTYDVTVRAVDLAGNPTDVAGTVEVLEPRKRKRRHRR